MSEASGSLPAGLLVRASPTALAGDFAAVAELQPLAWRGDGLVCAPRAAASSAAARRALASLAHDHRPLDGVPGWPDPPSGWMAGWYRRSPDHAPAPPGVRELIQTPGEGFGVAGHPTTALCLSLLTELPPGPALDAGCGSGVLTQAWIALRRGAVTAVDLDERALAQCRASLAAAGRADGAQVRRCALGALGADDVAERVLLANLPKTAHHELATRVTRLPRAALVAGLDHGGMAEVAELYERRGLRVRGDAESGRWRALVLEGA